METPPSGMDDDGLHYLAGSPSDALIGLDLPDFAIPTIENTTDHPLAEETPVENTSEVRKTLDDAAPTEVPADETLDADQPMADETMVLDEYELSVSVTSNIADAPTPTNTKPKDEDTRSEGIEETGQAPAAVVSEASVSPTIESEDDLQIHLPDTQIQPVKIEIILPYMSPEERANYISMPSDTVAEVIAEVLGPEGESWYSMEFTDGRRETIPLDDLLAYENGLSTLERFQNTMDSQNSFSGSADKHAKRPRPWHEPPEDSDTQSGDLMQLDDGDSSRHSKRQRSYLHRRSHLDSDNETIASRRSKRQRTATRQSTRYNTAAVSDDEDTNEPPKRGRQLRERTDRQLKLTSMAFANQPLTRDEDWDELSQELLLQSEDDDDFEIITSDLLPKTSQSRRKRSRRIKLKKTSRTTVEPRSRGSSIEFEDRRRSGRSTRNRGSMLDVALMDEDSFYVEDTATLGVPRVMNIKEVFKMLPDDSQFTAFHSDICGACNASSAANRGQLIGCQGCSVSFHKACLGYRSAREHIVTKIGVDDFVLQCKYCIGSYDKKERRGPRHDRCQQCKEVGRACAAFSPKKTPKQEEKIRLANGGEDPVTLVDPSLINNANNLLFRCTMCKRGWHYEHLPSSQMDSDVSEIRHQRLAEYSVDWKCIDCGTVSDKIQTLVAWRPAEKESFKAGNTYSDFSEDDKEYLIKWQGLSYAHCTWMPGAWVFHIAAGAMRNSFAKRDADENLALKFTTAEAVPEEYLLADVIFSVKLKTKGGRRSLEDDMDRIASVDKIYVKFQGLGYDETVWDSPPKPDSGNLYSAFKTAYYEYLTGKYFVSPSPAKMKERVNNWKKRKFVELAGQPPGLRRGQLMTYQIEGVNWMLGNYHEDKNIILADEMGLGKTVQVVGLISTLVHGDPKCWPFLVVVPNSTCPNWRREIKQWAPDLRVVTYHGGKQPQELAYNYELFPNGCSDIKAHVVVMSYDSAQDDRTKNLFRSVQWAGLVVDEGQRLKNDKSLLYTALRSMRFPFRLLLTGTPLQNNKRELFNLLQFIDPTQNAAKLDDEYQELNAQNLPKLHARIKQYFLRRTKAQVLKFLPPMAQIIVPVSMSILQEKLCKSIIAKSPDLIKAIFADDKINKRERGSLNNILMQLRKCLCHPFMYSEAVEERSADQVKMHQNLVSASGKLMLLNIMLPKLKERGHRVLIFSQFLDQLDIIEDFLNGLGYQHRRLDGKINSLEKQKHIDAFNNPDSEIFAFLLSTRAGGVGINLATADTVIILDPDFNPHQDIQAISRAHRIGQKHKVLCFQLMTKNSAEEKIMQIGRKKMALDHVLIEAMDDEGEPDDLESILKFGASALFSEDQNDKDIVRYDDASVEKLLDRSQIEQTKTGNDESAESQFSFARVWANDKGGFEDNLAEEHEPTVNANVWEEILAEREAEAKRIAELNKEVLGRGGRRRQAINYKSDGLVSVTAGLAGEHSGNSDNDGDFVGEDEEEPDTDAEDRAHDSFKGKARKSASPHSGRKKTPSSKKQQQVNSSITQKTRPVKTPTKSAAIKRGKTATPRRRTPQEPTPTKKPKVPSKRGMMARYRASKSEPQVKAPLRPTAEKPAGPTLLVHPSTTLIVVDNSSPEPQSTHLPISTKEVIVVDP
ncbi:Chromatin remodeling factor mit1 [Colletotrichum chlorophyti]|uniref:Chromatin remodeling factor mit1 n=1 Tax=Colletotrichum chlorophyti TaxID=708187 RepID=A0A1Q8RNQ6_9PEZI|nr:Chromatin remodeling factor mit1 [Colletotrichum chlorophyti]